MQQYAIANRGYRNFEITNEQGQYIGAMEYARWSPGKAKASVVEDIYEFGASGFWRMSVVITKNGMPYAEMKRTWRGGMTISFENGILLTLKRRSNWTNTYVLLRGEQEQLAIVKTKFVWSLVGLKYEVEMFKETGDDKLDILLPFLLVYCNRYLQVRYAAI